MLTIFKKSVAAGLSIAIAATVFLACDNKVVGAELFAFGLYAVCAMDQYLYTGKIGYVFTNRNKPNCFLVWLGNLIGAALVGLPVRFCLPALTEKAAGVMEKKLAEPWYAALLLGFFCGVIIYIAVECWKTVPGAGRVLGILFGVPVFILCGFEHSIADMGYAFYGITAWDQLPETLLFILLVSVGNGLGSLAFRFLTKAVAPKQN